ncbi:SMP-30/gluconolactonase/LRE family protein [Psychroflexus aestuariivivens]|uniref:SMP-30/gluconolactonase/LRE family protein n=1 Tax=Psychroflexus aestuariivivens TaxID=1795040 RepID=UPI000FD903DE|nr:SMP-30/gluconolactonase/LRE family protein [Psychroflexus aestuariivivens]
MKNIYFFLIAFSLLACQEKKSKTEINTDSVESGKIKNQEFEKSTIDFKFTEGPAVDANGNVYFTDIPEQKIWIWTTDNQIKIFRENSGGANGLYFDKDQNLWACEGREGQVSKTSPDGDYKVIASSFMGKSFNQPNDIWTDGKGGAYFTDPEYNETLKLPQGGMHVYYIKPNQEVIRVCSDLVRPNGLIGTPDGKKLYVTDHGDNKTYSYTIEKDGTLTNKSLFLDVGGDGMTIDQNGSIYLTTTDKKAVDVFSSEGKMFYSIALPEKPSNVCFGGKKRDELFITARTSIYKVKVDAVGVN